MASPDAVAALVLTVAPVPQRPQLPGTAIHDDPAAAYAAALGSSAAGLIDNYRIAAELPLFVGPAAYNGEQLLMWWPISLRRVPAYREYAGMYNGMFNTMQSNLLDFTPRDRKMLALRRPGELLLFDASPVRIATALRELAPVRPTLIRAATLRSGSVVLHVWLIRLGRYYGHPAGGLGRGPTTISLQAQPGAA
jgi:hypothetical protein